MQKYVDGVLVDLAPAEIAAVAEDAAQPPPQIKPILRDADLLLDALSDAGVIPAGKLAQVKATLAGKRG